MELFKLSEFSLTGARNGLIDEILSLKKGVSISFHQVRSLMNHALPPKIQNNKEDPNNTYIFRNQVGMFGIRRTPFHVNDMLGLIHNFR